MFITIRTDFRITYQPDRRRSKQALRTCDTSHVSFNLATEPWCRLWSKATDGGALSNDLPVGWWASTLSRDLYMMSQQCTQLRMTPLIYIYTLVRSRHRSHEEHTSLKPHGHVFILWIGITWQNLTQNKLFFSIDNISNRVIIMINVMLHALYTCIMFISAKSNNFISRVGIIGAVYNGILDSVVWIL